MTDIEQALFAGNVVHVVIEFGLAPGSVRLRIAARGGNADSTLATFTRAKITSLDLSGDFDEDDLNLPWEIIGLDNYRQSDDQWRFVLNCGELEWSWESEWPTIERG